MLTSMVTIQSYASIARALDVSGEAVRKWFLANRIPADRVLAVARATDWRITPHELRPDLYPVPTDGLPADHPLRAQNTDKAA